MVAELIKEHIHDVATLQTPESQETLAVRAKVEGTTRPIEPTDPFQKILSPDFENLPGEDKIRFALSMTKAFLDHPELEKGFFECMGIVLPHREVAAHVVEALKNKNPALIFIVLARHDDFPKVMDHYPIYRLTEKAAFALSPSRHSAEDIQCAFNFALKYSDVFIWPRSFIVWAAEEFPMIVIENATHKDWPESEFKKQCILTANKTLKKVGK